MYITLKSLWKRVNNLPEKVDDNNKLLYNIKIIRTPFGDMRSTKGAR